MQRFIITSDCDNESDAHEPGDNIARNDHEHRVGGTVHISYLGFWMEKYNGAQTLANQLTLLLITVVAYVFNFWISSIMPLGRQRCTHEIRLIEQCVAANPTVGKEVCKNALEESKTDVFSPFGTLNVTSLMNATWLKYRATERIWDETLLPGIFWPMLMLFFFALFIYVSIIFQYRIIRGLLCEKHAPLRFHYRPVFPFPPARLAMASVLMSISFYQVLLVAYWLPVATIDDTAKGFPFLPEVVFVIIGPLFTLIVLLIGTRAWYYGSKSIPKSSIADGQFKITFSGCYCGESNKNGLRDDNFLVAHYCDQREVKFSTLLSSNPTRDEPMLRKFMEVGYTQIEGLRSEMYLLVAGFLITLTGYGIPLFNVFAASITSDLAFELEPRAPTRYEVRFSGVTFMAGGFILLSQIFFAWQVMREVIKYSQKMGEWEKLIFDYLHVQGNDLSGVESDFPFNDQEWSQWPNPWCSNSCSSIEFYCKVCCKVILYLPSRCVKIFSCFLKPISRSMNVGCFVTSFTLAIVCLGAVRYASLESGNMFDFTLTITDHERRPGVLVSLFGSAWVMFYIVLRGFLTMGQESKAEPPESNCRKLRKSGTVYV